MAPAAVCVGRRLTYLGGVDRVDSLEVLPGEPQEQRDWKQEEPDPRQCTDVIALADDQKRNDTKQGAAFGDSETENEHL